MAWLESHQELGAHPKTRKFAHLLGINKVQAVGHLHYLWWWAMDYCVDGDLSKFEALDIAIGAEWDGDADVFLDALTRAGFADECDGELLIHDWPEYTGRLIERRRQDAERKRQYRAVRGTSAGQDADVHTTAYVTVPNHTVPNHTEPKSSVVEVSAPKSAPAQKRATRIAFDFTVSDELRSWAASRQFTPDEIARETEKFVNYWQGSGKTKADWAATWRTWMLNARERAPTPIHRNGHQSPKAAAYHSDMAKLNAIIERGE
jgi:hypothetical protein